MSTMWRYLQSSVSLILQTFPHNALPSRFSFVSSKWLVPPRTWRFSHRSPSTSLLMYSSPILPSDQINAVNQSQFILDARDALNHYNQQNNTQVTSLPLSQLFVVTSKAENSLGSVSWSIPSSFLTRRLDLGKETVSFYIEVKPSEDESPELQLLSIR